MRLFRRAGGSRKSAAGAPPALDRRLLAASFLRGDGIEIGPLNDPLAVPPAARVRYVDRFPAAVLREHYPELDPATIREVDVIDDGERLAGFADGALDFVIANHVLEHCEDPLGALGHFLRVLRPGGILYLAIPDKRLTFDRDRPVTPIAHLLRDHHDGPAWSRAGHFDEWVRLVQRRTDEADIAAETARLMAIGYSIHFHVWTAADMLEVLRTAQTDLGLDFEIEAFVRHANEVIAVLARR